MKSENAQSDSERPANYADSIEAAAGALGMSVPFLQRLKAMGCPAFRAGRVYLDECQTFVAENNLDGLAAQIDRELQVDADIKTERLLRMRHDREVREGRFILQEEHDKVMAHSALTLKALLQEKLEDQGPDLLTMRTREEAQDILRRMFDEICEKMHRA